MPDSKITLVESRLRKRMRILEFVSFEQYVNYLFSPEGEQNERIPMIDCITTNKTDFFREAGQFKFLVETAVPELTKLYGSNANRQYKIWSAGCSTGEEPYTLAMVLSQYLEKHHEFSFSILATDISTRVLEHASLGIYREETIAPVPASLRAKYLLRDKDRSRGRVRVVPQLRALIQFRRLNFMDADFGIRTPVDVIFCRNVLIYFDRQTQARLLMRLYRQLTPGGYLFIGCSETLCGMDIPLRVAGQMVYRKSA